MALTQALSPYAIYMPGECDSTVILAFSYRDIPAGKFGHYKILSGLPYSKLLVNCVHESWYQDGIPPFGDTIDATARAIEQFLHKKNVTRVVCFGHSMGGYAALLYGNLLSADSVLAFAPEVILNWPGGRAVKHLRGRGDPKHVSLVRGDRVWKRNRSRLFFGKNELLDTAHALIWHSVSLEPIHMLDDCGHAVAPHLNYHSLLGPLINEVASKGTTSCVSQLEADQSHLDGVYGAGITSIPPLDDIVDGYKKICAMDPGNAHLQFQMAQTLRSAKRHSEAATYAERALHFRPLPSHRALLIKSLFETKKFSECLYHIQRLPDDYASKPEILMMHAEVCAALDDIGEAARLSLHAFEIERLPKQALFAARCFRNQNEFVRAIDILEKAINNSSGNINIFLEKAAIHEKIKEFDRSYECIEMALMSSELDNVARDRIDRISARLNRNRIVSSA
ncbi:alpha/beta fold hydrolase [Gluconacetobacter tumulisoli]|uniref:Alpha/beta hydrolase n=1 Tax=Gluconacetobacter tumulisoli TaxID=1286189 RepID=A0A7W4KAJ0_9PROT|nr:alpha/beta hydrolase [Gluconacetobacter tumulisoli]MBB2203374.1 hypothetical protein [Gluconacetobacter tumulisoli]